MLQRSKHGISSVWFVITNNKTLIKESKNSEVKLCNVTSKTTDITKFVIIRTDLINSKNI